MIEFLVNVALLAMAFVFGPILIVALTITPLALFILAITYRERNKRRYPWR